MQGDCSLNPKSVLHCTDCALKLHQLKVQSIPWFNHLLYLCASYNHIDNFWKFCLQYSIFSAVFAIFHRFSMILCVLPWFLRSGLFLVALGAVEAKFWTFWGRFWPPRTPLGSLLGGSWALLGLSWALLGRSWNPCNPLALIFRSDPVFVSQLDSKNGSKLTPKSLKNGV